MTSDNSNPLDEPWWLEPHPIPKPQSRADSRSLKSVDSTDSIPQPPQSVAPRQRSLRRDSNAESESKEQTSPAHLSSMSEVELLEASVSTLTEAMREMNDELRLKTLECDALQETVGALSSALSESESNAEELALRCEQLDLKLQGVTFVDTKQLIHNVVHIPTSHKYKKNRSFRGIETDDDQEEDDMDNPSKRRKKNQKKKKSITPPPPPSSSSSSRNRVKSIDGEDNDDDSEDENSGREDAIGGSSKNWAKPDPQKQKQEQKEEQPKTKCTNSPPGPSLTPPGQAAFYNVILERDQARRQANRLQQEVLLKREQVRRLKAKLTKSTALIELSYQSYSDRNNTNNNNNNNKSNNKSGPQLPEKNALGTTKAFPSDPTDTTKVSGLTTTTSTSTPSPMKKWLLNKTARVAAEHLDLATTSSTAVKPHHHSDHDHVAKCKEQARKVVAILDLETTSPTTTVTMKPHQQNHHHSNKEHARRRLDFDQFRDADKAAGRISSRTEEAPTSPTNASAEPPPTTTAAAISHHPYVVDMKRSPTKKQHPPIPTWSTTNHQIVPTQQMVQQYQRRRQEQEEQSSNPKFPRILIEL